MPRRVPRLPLRDAVARERGGSIMRCNRIDTDQYVLAVWRIAAE
jgi:hypothetical protein